jgi:multidrug transporter EmrE-like cation transporter
MNYMFLAAAILSGIHGYTFCQWLWKNGNSLGAIGVLVLILISVALPIYRIINPGQ